MGALQLKHFLEKISQGYVAWPYSQQENVDVRNASFLRTSRFLTGGGTGDTILRRRRMVHLVIRATTYSPTSKRH